MAGRFKQRVRRPRPDVWRIVVPTPWPVGPVNVYVIDDEPLTLVDTGPASPEAVAAIEAGLAEHGKRVEDLGRLVVSHQHTDHWGGAAWLAERSGAEVCAVAGLDSYMSRYPESLFAEDAFADDLLHRHGAVLPAGGSRIYRGDLSFAAAVATDRVLRDGDVVAFGSGAALRVLERPGHSPTDIVLLDEATGVMLGADHVMAKRAVPILGPPPDGSVGPARPRRFAEYLSSLRATDALDVRHVLPGHGAPVEDPHGMIALRLAEADRMTARMDEALGDEPRTALELMRDVRGRGMPDSATFFVICDALGHLDALLDAGVAVEQADDDGRTRFSRA